MNIAVIGCELQSIVAASLFASVGNKVDIFEQKKKFSRFLNEPGLERLLNEQEDSTRLSFCDISQERHISYDFILIAGESPKNIFSSYLKVLTNSLSKGVNFVILAPSEIGEAKSFSSMLYDEKLTATVSCVPVLVREGRAIGDFSRPENIIVGCDDSVIANKISHLFYPFNRVRNVLKVVSTKEAEFSTFAGNAMLATRLSFMNEMANLAEKCDVDIDVIRECIGSDPRIGHEYLYPGCGYGGRTLAENVEKVAKELRFRTDNPGLMDAVIKINERQKDLLFRKVWMFFKSELAGRKIALWGASFKPGSASIVGAPAIELIKSLLAQSVKVSVYDPMAATNLRNYFGSQDGLTIADSQNEVVVNADALVICTEWKEFWSPDFENLNSVLKYKAIFDGRNLYSPELLNKHGLKYFAIGKGDKI